MRRPVSAYWLLLTGVLFVWAGMVGAISFMEAPLKFTAPHITVALGVGIGRVVFHALNKVELALCLLALGSAGALRVPTHVWRGLVLATVVLMLETAWLLPALDLRAEALLQGTPAPASYHHWLYIGLDAVKLLTLVVAGALTFRAALSAALAPVPGRVADGRTKAAARRHAETLEV